MASWLACAAVLALPGATEAQDVEPPVEAEPAEPEEQAPSEAAPAPAPQGGYGASGGATDATGVANLKKQGFASIISFRLPTEQGVAEEEAAVKTTGIKYIHLPLNGAMPDAKVADEFLAAVSDKSNQPAYIHCGGGGRAASMWMIKRAMKDGWTMDRAAEEANAIATLSPTLKTFATNYIAAHK